MLTTTPTARCTRNGPDHFGNHAVMMMFGKHVNAGVTGGSTAIANGAYGAVAG